jgi:hypothetical protein
MPISITDILTDIPEAMALYEAIVAAAATLPPVAAGQTRTISQDVTAFQSCLAPLAALIDTLIAQSKKA